MSREKKIKLFGQAILQDFLDSNNQLEIIKNAFDLTRNNNIKLALCNVLDDNESSNQENIYLCDKWITKHFQDFYYEFHLTKSTFYTLLNEIKQNDDLLQIYQNKNYSLPIEKSLLITLWFLARGIPLYDISDKFDLIPTSVFPIIKVIIKILVNMQDKYIIWPNDKLSEIYAQNFFTNYGYPNVVGAMGNIHVHFKPPNCNEEIFRNDKMGYSVILQGICNPDKQFINIFSGFPGSIDCASILKHSLLYKELEETTPGCFFYNKYHLVANELYPLRSWLMTPFRHNQILSIEHSKHNIALTDTLTTIEDTFVLLKGRWKILNFINISDVESVKEIIEACCVLHNFCIQRNDTFDNMLSHLDHDSMSSLEYLDVTREGERKRNRNLNIFI